MPTVNGSTWSGGRNSYLYMSYTITQNIAGNYSDIAYTFGIHFGTGDFRCDDQQVAWTGIWGTPANDLWDGPNVGSYPWPGHPSWTGSYNATIHAATFRHYHLSDGTGKTHFYGQVVPSSFGGGGLRSLFFDILLPTISQLSTAPSTPVLTSVTSSSMIATFTDGTGGAAIDSRQLAYNTVDDVDTATTMSSDGSDTISGLASGTTYYVWARTHNAAGYSPWSSSESETTLGVPDAPSQPVLSNITQTTIDVSWSPNGNGGSTILNYDIAYDTDSDISGATVLDDVGSSPYTITDLTPGETYFVWVRARNAIGDSAWSLVASSTSIAGVRIKYGGVWVLAIPYVKDSGEWKLARPWVKSGGVWKEAL